MLTAANTVPSDSSGSGVAPPKVVDGCRVAVGSDAVSVVSRVGANVVPGEGCAAFGAVATVVEGVGDDGRVVVVGVGAFVVVVEVGG